VDALYDQSDGVVKSGLKAPCNDSISVPDRAGANMYVNCIPRTKEAWP
jgi:hypothetical protein